MKLQDLNTQLSMNPLCECARHYGTDKWQHGYTRVYYHLLKDKEKEENNIFEIGIYYGNSLRMWSNYYVNSKIFGMDNGQIHLGTSGEDYLSDEILQEQIINQSFGANLTDIPRMKYYIGDQKSQRDISNALDYFECDQFDLILDDGSHFQEEQQKTLGLLFPHVKSGGYYIIEDVIAYSDLLSGSKWNQKKQDCTDSTDYVFMEFLRSGKLESDYLSDSESKYIINNISDIFLFDKSNNNGSPIVGTSKLLVIKKK